MVVDDRCRVEGKEGDGLYLLIVRVMMREAREKVMEKMVMRMMQKVMLMIIISDHRKMMRMKFKMKVMIVRMIRIVVEGIS